MDEDDDVAMASEGLEWKFSQAFGERVAGEEEEEEEVQEGTNSVDY